MENDKRGCYGRGVKNTCQMTPLSFIQMVRTSREDPLWTMEHFAYRKVIKLWGFSSAPMQKKMERFPYFSWCPSKTGTAYGK